MITEDIRYIGVNDHDIDLFEGQYQVPNGISYNSYVIMDEKIAIMDTVDKRKQTEFLENLETALAGRTPDYLVISHMEPDHASSIQAVVERYPETETYVTEEIYEILRINLAGLMGEKDDYLDVFVQDMVYSDQPIKKSISEDLADIYQDIKDFIFVFQLGLNETMNDSLAICQENFGLLWGQKLVNTLRALHDVKYNQQNENDEEDNEEENNELSDDDYCCEEDGCHCHDDECHCHEDGCHCRNDE